MMNMDNMGGFLQHEKGISSFVPLFLCLLLSITGCIREVKIESDRKNTEYEICVKEQLPGELQKTIEEKKKKACTFSFHDSKYTYLIVCYGEKKYAGYSIRVEECSKGNQVLYMRTQLIGPSAGEPIAERKNWPYLVVRCKRTDSLCLIEP